MIYTLSSTKCWAIWSVAKQSVNETLSICFGKYSPSPSVSVYLGGNGGAGASNEKVGEREPCSMGE